MKTDLNYSYAAALTVCHGILLNGNHKFIELEAHGWGLKGQKVKQALNVDEWFYGMTLDDDLCLCDCGIYDNPTEVFGYLSIESLDCRIGCVLLLNNETIFSFAMGGEMDALLFDGKEWHVSETPEYDFDQKISMFFNNLYPIRAWFFKVLRNRQLK